MTGGLCTQCVHNWTRPILAGEDHESLQEGIELGLGIKFGARGLKLMPAIRRIQDAGRLKAIKEAVKIAGNIKQVKEVISD